MISRHERYSIWEWWFRLLTIINMQNKQGLKVYQYVFFKHDDSPIWEVKSNSWELVKIWVYFNSSKKDRNIFIRTHINNSAMLMLREHLMEEHWPEWTNKILKWLISFLKKLYDEKTPLLVSYIPTSYFKDEELNKLGNIK